MSSSCIFSLLNLTEVTSNRESLYMKTSSQILDLTSLPSRRHFRPTRYITIFPRRIQKLQTFKIPTDVICTLRFLFRFRKWSSLYEFWGSFLRMVVCDGPSLHLHKGLFYLNHYPSYQSGCSLSVLPKSVYSESVSCGCSLSLLSESLSSSSVSPVCQYRSGCSTVGGGVKVIGHRCRRNPEGIWRNFVCLNPPQNFA